MSEKKMTHLDESVVDGIIMDMPNNVKRKVVEKGLTYAKTSYASWDTLTYTERYLIVTSWTAGYYYHKTTMKGVIDSWLKHNEELL